MRKFRFGIRSVFVVVAISAVTFFAVLQYRSYLERVRLCEMRSAFMHWATQTSRSDGKIHTYFNLNQTSLTRTDSRAGGSSVFLVSNAVMTYQADRSPSLVFRGFPVPPDPVRFYLLPAKKWVDNTEDVLKEWDAWRHHKR